MTNWSIADVSPSREQNLTIKQVRELTAPEYDALMAANQCLKTMLGRTTFGVLSQNYRTFNELEQEALTRAASAALDEALRTSIVTAVVNYLTTMRMFLDHSEADLRRRDAQDGGNRFGTWKIVCSAEYDDYFGYRFLYRFRNYIQHVGLPLSILTVSSSLNDDGRVVGSVFLGESPHHLVEEFDGWSKVGAELEALSTELDLSEQIHVSMECLTRIAEALLQEDKPEIAASAATFRAIIGDLDEYIGTPWLVQFPDNRDYPIVDITVLDIQRFRVAEQIAASQESNA